MKRLVCSVIVLILLCAPLLCLAVSSVNEASLPIEKGDAGSFIVMLQKRLADLGYLQFGATGKYGDMTASAVRVFQKRNGLTADGVTGEDTYYLIFSASAVRADQNASIPRVLGKGQISPIASGALADWYKTVSELYPKGSTVTVYDYNTGKAMNMKRIGGENHADVQPADQESYDNLMYVIGGDYSWAKRPVILEIGDQRIAGSLFCHPNNDASIGYTTGSLCLFFAGSKSDVAGGLPDAEHEAALLTANGQ